MIYYDTWYNLPESIDLSVPLKNRENTFKELKKVVTILNDSLKTKYFFSCGTALGIIRDNKLIDWDVDIDIDLINPTDKELEYLTNQMLKNDYKIYRQLKKNGRYIQLVFVKKPYHSIDFCIWYNHFDGYINDIPETIYLKRVHSKSLYDEFKEIKFNNINIQLPKNHIKYFETLYGRNWKKPKKYSFWINNANDLRIDSNLFRVFFKILWKLKIVRKKISLVETP